MSLFMLGTVASRQSIGWFLSTVCMVMLLAGFTTSHVLAAGLVPCSGNPGDPCTPCHVVSLVKNIVDWLIQIGTILLVLLYTGAGLYLVTSQGNLAAKTSARRLIISATIGYVILAGIWILMSLFMRLLLGADEIQGYGPWIDVLCRP